jgi:polar amino acid transport system substrate-binding protein
MFSRRTHLAGLVAPVAALATVIGLSACGSSAPSQGGASAAGTTATLKANPTLKAELPASIRKSGVLQAAIDPSFPINNYYAADGKTVIGLSPDLLKDAAQVLGVKLQISAVSLATIIPGMQAGRYDVAGMVLLDSSAREQQIALLDFQKAGQELLVAAANPAHLTNLTSTCGHTVAVEEGGDPVTILQAQSKACTSAGKAAVTIQQFPNDDQALLAVENNRADATITDFTKSGYEVQHSNGQLKLVGPQFSATDAGWGVPKGSSLGKALQGALDELIKDGTYNKVFAKYQLTQAELPQAVINGAAATSG